MSKRLIIKIIVATILICMWKFANHISPVILNKLAMYQMDNTEYSSILLEIGKYFMSNAWLIIVVVLILMFCKDVVKIIKIIREKYENEEY